MLGGALGNEYIQLFLQVWIPPRRVALTHIYILTYILTEIPLGSRRVEIGLALRDAWFLNGILFNSEVWGSYAEKHIEELMVIDNMILRTVVGAQAKVPVETLYLETSTLSIKHVISVRRMLYLKTILSRHEDEVVRRVYTAMKERPLKGDWYNRVALDFEQIQVKMDEEAIMGTDLVTYKTLIKTAVWKLFFKELQGRKDMHIKVKHVQYSGNRLPQSYLTSSKFDNSMTSLLFNLRCSSLNEFKDNFHTQYGKSPPCKLICGMGTDSQRHALSCSAIIRKLTPEELNSINQLNYSFLFGSMEEQLQIITIYQRIIEIRAAADLNGLPGPNNSGPD